MKISKQLSKILISLSLILFVQITQAQEIKEIWTEIEKKKEVSSNETTNNENNDNAKTIPQIVLSPSSLIFSAQEFMIL